GIDPARRLRLLVHAGDPGAARDLATHRGMLSTLARLDEVRAVEGFEGHGPMARAVVPGVDLAVPMTGVLDLEAERRRLGREIDRSRREVEGHDRKLSNPEFLEKAKPEAIERAQRAQQELRERIERLTRTVESLR
ncbi:MAG: hypothetical protein ACRD5D_01600, partial [Candidatus Polarisedimenticolia bacterium]